MTLHKHHVRRVVLCLMGCFLSAFLSEAKASDEATAMKSFQTFAERWMSQLAEISSTNREAAPKGGMQAVHYTAYGPEKEFSIKKTSSKVTPFIGILKYFEKQKEKQEGVTQGFAVDTTIHEIEVTEIFRFSKGKWVY